MDSGLDFKAVWTPLKILQWATPYLKEKGIANPRLDVEILIAHALGMDRLKVYLQFDRPLDTEELTRIRGFLKRRSLHEPIQYITGQREFYGISFKVTSDVLIPRPETEQLVELGIEFLKGIEEKDRKVLDLGTGSGCIPVSIAKNISCQIWAVDQSEKALGIAKENALLCGVDGVMQWRCGDWFDGLRPEDPLQFSLILSNPPYISLGEKETLAREVVEFEPLEALFTENNGLKSYEDISQGLPKRLKSRGAVLLEINPLQKDNVLKLFQPLYLRETLYLDGQGLPRILKLEK